MNLKKGAILKRIPLFFIFIFLCLVQFAFADVITLKSGGKLKGRILEQTNATVKFQVSGGVITLSREDIVAIEDVDDQPSDLVPDWTPPETKSKNSRFAPKKPKTNQLIIIAGQHISSATHAGAPVSPATVSPFSNSKNSVITPEEFSRGVQANLLKRFSAQRASFGKMASKLNAKTVAIGIGIILALLIAAFLFSALVFKILSQVLGGTISFSEALVFQVKWSVAKMLIMICAAALLAGLVIFAMKFPQALGKGVLFSLGAVIFLIFIVSLFYVYIRMAREATGLSVGQAWLLIVLEVVTYVAINILFKVFSLPLGQFLSTYLPHVVQQ